MFSSNYVSLGPVYVVNGNIIIKKELAQVNPNAIKLEIITGAKWNKEDSFFSQYKISETQNNKPELKTEIQICYSRSLDFLKKSNNFFINGCSPFDKTYKRATHQAIP